LVHVLEQSTFIKIQTVQSKGNVNKRDTYISPQFGRFPMGHEEKTVFDRKAKFYLVPLSVRKSRLIII